MAFMASLPGFYYEKVKTEIEYSTLLKPRKNQKQQKDPGF